MATINDATVVTSAYELSGNGGRKLVRLSNGWLVSIVYDSANTTHRVYKSTDNGQTWSQVCSMKNSTLMTVPLSLVSNGNRVVIFGTLNNANTLASWTFDVTTQSNVDITNTYTLVDSSQTTHGNCSLAINEAGTELHAAFASKNSSYPNSFNIRYAKGTINGDGSVTWGTAQQLTTYNISGNNIQNPTIICRGSIAHILYEWKNGSNYGISHLSSADSFVAGTSPQLSTTYSQSSPSAMFVPQSMNGLTSGRIHVAWHGLDATDTTQQNIRYSYSDDGGVTWSAAQKLTTGNTNGQVYASITANKANEIFVVYKGSTVSTANSDYRIKQIKNTSGTWGAVTQIKAQQAEDPSALYDPNLNFTSPLFIYKDVTGAKVGFYGTWTVTTMTVTPGALGTKSDKSNLLTYTITTDGTMSAITESINGTVVNTRSVASGTQVIAGLTQAQWDAIKYGKYKDATGGLNTLTVSMGSETWTYTFDKRLATDADILSAVKAVQDSQSTYLPSIKKQLVDKVGGVTSDPFENIIKNAEIGKKWAKGVTTSGITVDNIITVTGLAFRPRYIMWENQSNGTYVGFYNPDMQFTNYPTDIYMSSASSYDNYSKSNVIITDTSFSLPTGYGSSGTAVNFNWWAFE